MILSRRRWRGGRRFAAVVFAGLCLGKAPAALAESSTDPTRREPEPHADDRRVQACQNLASSPWPRTAYDRRLLIQRLEAAREACKDQADFLALLGGTWLEEGEPDQALLWLERALMLQPDLLAAQADHALALAAKGDHTARHELVKRWQGRTDVPPLLWARLTSAHAAALAANQAPADSHRQWAASAELAILSGYESNLDRSPRLSELTITPPDGPIRLPLTQPLVPRPGGALVADASGQIAFSPRAGTVLQVGVMGTARVAPDESATDWHNGQFAAALSQRLNGWRLQGQANFSWFGGALNEPYRLDRWTLSLESNGLGCLHRASVDREARRQRVTSLSDGVTWGGLVSSLCPSPLSPRWAVGLALRVSSDAPVDPQRPGGRQDQWSLGLRAIGPLAGPWRIDGGLRLSFSRDRLGYSPLLENDARRRLSPIQLNLEVSRPLNWADVPGAEALIQLQALNQDSNLPIFQYSAVGAYAGIRMRW